MNWSCRDIFLQIFHMKSDWNKSKLSINFELYCAILYPTSRKYWITGLTWVELSKNECKLSIEYVKAVRGGGEMVLAKIEMGMGYLQWSLRVKIWLIWHKCISLYVTYLREREYVGASHIIGMTGLHNIKNPTLSWVIILRPQRRCENVS